MQEAVVARMSIDAQKPMWPPKEAEEVSFSCCPRGDSLLDCNLALHCMGYIGSELANSCHLHIFTPSTPKKRSSLMKRLAHSEDTCCPPTGSDSPFQLPPRAL